MTFDIREVPSIVPETGTIVNGTSGSVRKACEETALLKLKVYRTDIIEAVRILMLCIKCMS